MTGVQFSWATGPSSCCCISSSFILRTSIFCLTRGFPAHYLKSLYGPTPSLPPACVESEQLTWAAGAAPGRCHGTEAVRAHGGMREPVRACWGTRGTVRARGRGHKGWSPGRPPRPGSPAAHAHWRPGLAPSSCKETAAPARAFPSRPAGARRDSPGHRRWQLGVSPLLPPARRSGHAAPPDAQGPGPQHASSVEAGVRLGRHHLTPPSPIRPPRPLPSVCRGAAPGQGPGPGERPSPSPRPAVPRPHAGLECRAPALPG